MRKLNLLTAFILLVTAIPAWADRPAGQPVDYSDGETTFKGRLFVPEGADTPLPGVLVVHEWWGQNEHARASARRLSEMGYVALAVDMYGDGQVADHPRDAGEMAGRVHGDAEVMQQRFTAADGFLRGLEAVDGNRIAAIGYCFGGMVVLEMARAGADLKGVASFHGSLGTRNPARPGQVQAQVLVLHGADDPLVPPEQVQALRDEMEAAGAVYEVIEYPGVTHSFTNPDADRVAAEFDLPLAYDAAADHASWAALTRFLESLFSVSHP